MCGSEHMLKVGEQARPSTPAALELRAWSRARTERGHMVDARWLCCCAKTYKTKDTSPDRDVRKRKWNRGGRRLQRQSAGNQDAAAAPARPHQGARVVMGAAGVNLLACSGCKAARGFRLSAWRSRWPVTLQMHLSVFQLHPGPGGAFCCFRCETPFCSEAAPLAAQIHH